MRPQPCELRRLSCVLLVSALLLFPQSLRAQATSLSQVPVWLIDLPIRSASDPATDAPLPRPPGTLPRFSGDQMLSLGDKGGLRLPEPAGISDSPGRTKECSGSDSKWWSSPVSRSRPDHTMQPEDLHHIPLAGPLILRVHQQAKTHPQVTRVLKLLAPVAK